ncbi:Acyl-CoA dehydrogenase [Thermomonospora echinospora]|uniref:Acyl-CoA dehydrogenase n=1 Tax=Thermomonospora echinospora TaxID=1992 RepID=A0A1H6DE98_9ACTN|nr:acyl-CoA dehydrogenase family protein [Thermomonospora echinospora]SEG83757.1 Acyl-CoA dehydrogenase [Thermomonospora echinospora]
MPAESPGLSELHDELRAVARDLLGKADAEAAADWRSIAGAGWPGLEVPGAFDGADATFAEVAVILQEMGRAAARGPYAAVAVLGVGVLNLLESGPDRDRLLRDTAAGDAVPVAVLEGEAMGETSFRIARTARGPLLHGTADFVLDAPAADRLLVPALDPDGTPVIVGVDPRAAGLSVERRPVLDATRGFGRVAVTDVSVPPESVWRFRGDPQEAVRRLRDRAAVAMACDSLGLSKAMLEATVAYAGVREQFGRKIGSFQAVKHACADMLVQVSVARELVAAAVRGQAGDEPGAAVAASMAKSYACAAAVEVAGKAMQLHGGMGYTWESGVHVYLKRAALNRSLFGSPALHRRRLAERYSPLARERLDAYGGSERSLS